MDCHSYHHDLIRDRRGMIAKRVLGMKRYWTAAATFVGDEHLAAFHMERRGFPFYLPTIIVRSQKTGNACRRLLFPGYILFKLKEGWEHLIHIRGIYQFFFQDEKPVRIPTNQIDRFKRLEDKAGLINDVNLRFAVGDHVRVRYDDSLFTKKTGRIVKVDLGQCEVEFELLGRAVRKTFSELMLEPAR